MVFSVVAVFASVPSPVVFFACFLLVLTFLGAFALRLSGLEDEPEYYEEIGPDGKPRVAFQFPPQETREERRRRWARALRRRFWPGLARVREGPEVKAQIEREVDAFVKALLSASVAAKAQHQPHTTNQHQWQSFDPEYDILIFREPEPQPKPEESLSLDEAQKLRKKVFSVVMNAGPPKSLPPITEEHQSAEDIEFGSSAEELTVAEASLWDFFSQMDSKPPPLAWVEHDSEPIMTVGEVKATRSVLWAALRKLEQIEVQ